jgi:hypothetical protein
MSPKGWYVFDQRAMRSEAKGDRRTVWTGSYGTVVGRVTEPPQGCMADAKFRERVSSIRRIYQQKIK